MRARPPHIQDYDWADEVLHSQIGRRWYVGQMQNLNEALNYGDRCWTKIVSHWQRYLTEGKTTHRNWWPEIYRTACERWRIEPDAQALAFSETYEAKRADLHGVALHRASAPSRLNFRVEPLQFDPCFVDRELPIDGSLLLVDAG